MGITTVFKGSFVLSVPLAPEQRLYLTCFSQTRRVKRSVEHLQELADPIRTAVGLPLGSEGAYFVGQDSPYSIPLDDTSVVDLNTPPEGQPGLWCQWVPTDDGTAITWNGGDSFYYYVEWIEYLVEHFLAPWGHVLNGTVSWECDEAHCWSDEAMDLVPCVERGEIVIQNNIVSEQNRETELL